MLWTNTWKAADWLLQKHSRNSRIMLLRSILHRSGFYIFKENYDIVDLSSCESVSPDGLAL